MKTVLIFYDYFYPAYKAGGPITSLFNLVKLLHEKISFYVVTQGKDYDGSLLEVDYNVWVEQYGAKVYYFRNRPTYHQLKLLVEQVQPTVIYLNGIFSPRFFLFPLSIGFKLKKSIIIAPRGMLQDGALSSKATKKRIYLEVVKKIFPLKKVTWHATDPQEQIDIKKNITVSAEIHVCGNIPSSIKRRKTSPEMEEWRFVSISLIASKKNLLASLAALQAIKNEIPIVYDIYGPIKEEDYYRLIELAMSRKSNATIKYKGEIHPQKVPGRLSEYHYFILPTKGENFGHSIFEAMSVGLPVIISDKTPWKALKTRRAGWDVDISNETNLVNAIKEAISLSKPAYDEYCQGARKVVEDYMNNADLDNKYTSLFSGIPDVSSK